MKILLGKIAYAMAFAVALPLLLAAWTAALPLPLPTFRSASMGAFLLGLGLTLAAWAILALWFRGGGLPMNAFPPPRWVSTGPYGIVAHPIYLGFTMACAGAAFLAGSATGFWLTTPLSALGCTALVVGYEAPSLARRFGRSRHRPFLALPRVDDTTLRWPERAGSLLLVLGLWAMVYVGIQALGAAPDAIDTNLGRESRWPVWVWTEAVYASAYLAVPAAFLLAPDRAALRRLCLQGLAATALVGLVYLCLPFISPPRPFQATGPLASLLRLEHAWTLSPAASFPSFHVLWAGLAAQAVASRGGAWRFGAWAWALALAGSCMSTGMHSSLDVAAAVALWPFLCGLKKAWIALLGVVEGLSNAWRAWRLGPFRILNHSLFPGLAAVVGFLGATVLRGSAGGVSVVAAAVLLGAGLMAFWIEGSPELSRPFGFHGGLIGATMAVIVLAATPWGGWILVAALSAMAPLIQAIGRLRCLVQGCCHGAPASEAWLGIRIHEPHSRVSALAHLQGVAIHPTPLYSILANLLIAGLLARLWSLRAPLALVTGAYLVLSGLARFMEEAYRGEPQTPVFGGLHLYQWIAVASVAAGMLVATLPSPPAPTPSLAAVGPWQVLGACLCGLAFAFAMGMDFPDSGRRFARLSG